MATEAREHTLIHIPAWPFIAFCAVAAAGILFAGRFALFPSWIIALEVVVTVFALFVFGSIRIRLDKNALAYGAVLVIAATFWNAWWPSSSLRTDFYADGWLVIGDAARRYLLTLRGWDELIHADAMLFILGLTFFVAAIAETRLLERFSLFILEKNRGRIVPTVAILAAVVSLASGILDGVSMIGLMIRTLAIVLGLANAKKPAVMYVVMMSTIITTVCGMWLAYGEPPNLIMKANLHPHLPDLFFLRFCLPVAVGAYAIVVFNMRRLLKGLRVAMSPEISRNAFETGASLRKAQLVGLFSFIPFVGLLLWHAANHGVALFWSSFAGCAVAFGAIRTVSGAASRAIREAKHEYTEYLFLLPLFLSVTFLQKTGFFEHIAVFLKEGVSKFGTVRIAYGQFAGATFLSAVLDNNVVADFASRAIHGFDLGLLHLFAMAQIAGYAVGGCWTHIGSAQSVVAYAFIKRNVSDSFTPFEWIKAITPVAVEIFLLAAALIYIAAWIMRHAEVARFI